MTKPDTGLVWEPPADYQAAAEEHDQMQQAGEGHASELRDPWFDQPEARDGVQE